VLLSSEPVHSIHSKPLQLVFGVSVHQLLKPQTYAQLLPSHSLLLMLVLPIVLQVYSLLLLSLLPSQQPSANHAILVSH